MNFAYSDAFYPDSSSVIQAAFYDETTSKLVVRLHNNWTLAGYDNVAKGVWDNFKAEDRLGGSVGKFWNTMIKPNYTGFTTSDISAFLSVAELASGVYGTDAVNRSVHSKDPVVDIVGPVEVAAAEETDAPEIDVVRPVEDVKAGADIGQHRYEITFEVVSVETKTVVVYAANDVEAENDFLADVDEVNIVDVRRRR